MLNLIACEQNKSSIKSVRKGSLDEIARKNKDQILYYVPKAKIQIYPQCIICYDPKFYVGLITQPCDSYLNSSTEIGGATKQKQKLNESNNQKGQNNKNQSASQDQGKKNEQVGNCKKNNNHNPNQINFKGHRAGTSPGKSERAEAEECSCNQKIIYFNNPDLAFYIEESQNAIEIHNLAEKRLELRFNVDNTEVVSIIQSLLRKKLCELGFFKKYRIIKLLGKGGTALVHLVQRVSDKKNFAAKIISTLNSSQKQFQLFTNQAKLLRILKHKNIIHLESVYIHKTQLIQVLEYLPGGTLLDFLKKTEITTGQKWSYLKDLTLALDYLRQRRIVHRDLKLENIMIRVSSVSREVVLSDFGLACWAGQKSPIYQKCGTPGYIAPEILNIPAKTILIDHRSDIFSLGVIAHLLFLHEPLFHFKGNLKDLIEENKKASYNLYSTRYTKLSTQQLNFLLLTLPKDINSRVTADQLLGIVNLMATKQQKKSVQKPRRKLSMEAQNPIMDIQVRKQGSLRKRAIKIDLECIKSKKDETKQSESKSPTRRSIAASAKKAVSNFWQAISPTSKKSEGLKLKQNSVQKQRKYSDFLNQ